MPRRLLAPLPAFLTRSALLGGLLAAFLATLLSLSGVLERADWFFYHAAFEIRGPQPVPSDLMVVAIDEPTLEELGVWPLPRSLYGTLIDGVLDAGATVVGIDVTFPQQSQIAGADASLAAALKRHPGRVVLAANFQPWQSGKDVKQQLVLPLAAFRAVSRFGLVDVAFDADGSIHRYTPRLDGVDPDDLSALKAYESFDWLIANAHAEGRLPPELAARDRDWLINYVGPPGRVPSVPMISLFDALKHHDQAFLSHFKGRAVLVGATSLRLQDQYPTPYSAAALGGGLFDGGGSVTYMPGVEIHANVVHTLLHANPITPAPPLALWAVLLLVGLGAGGVLAAIPPAPGLGAALAIALVGLLLDQALFAGARVWLAPAAPLLELGGLYVAAVGGHFLRAESTRRFYRQTFERYVAKDIVEELLRNPGLAPKLGGERREVTVLFSDIRNFTTISETRSPEDVVEFLNAYLTAMAEVIHGEKGCIDKYIGDAILALWGNVKPIPPEEAAARAVRSALAMKARVEALRPAWEAAGYPYIDIGIGVNTGEAVVGNIGSPDKLEFGVIGDSINVASRLEGLTKEYGGATVISGRTRELLGAGFDCAFLASVKVKGRAAPVDIYAVLAERPVMAVEGVPSD